MTLLTGRMTAAQFMALPEDPNKTRYELVHGEVVVSPTPNLDHAFVSARLLTTLAIHVNSKGLGVVIADTDTYFDEDDVRRPDILYFSKARYHFLQGNYPAGPPDLCVEILSPSNRHIDRGDKFELYRDCGVPHYWIFDPMTKVVEAYGLAGKDYVPAVTAKDEAIVHLPPFTELEIRLADIWRPARFA